jgi:hypothetical protein
MCVTAAESSLENCQSCSKAPGFCTALGILGKCYHGCARLPLITAAKPQPSQPCKHLLCCPLQRVAVACSTASAQDAIERLQRFQLQRLQRLIALLPLQNQTFFSSSLSLAPSNAAPRRVPRSPHAQTPPIPSKHVFLGDIKSRPFPKM